jgi:hypothetical protein
MRKLAERNSSAAWPINWLAAGFMVTAILMIGGCNSPDSEEGEVINEIVLPTDISLNLQCAEVGIAFETCVENDPENPYRTATIREFNVNDPDADTKFALFNQIPAGPSGAKARFYLWATALARFPSGENQWYASRALHELWDAQVQQALVGEGLGDPIVQAQALKAYQSVLDNFFGSVTFFECCIGVDPANPGDPVAFSANLNELTADNLYRTASTDWARLVPGDPLLTKALIAEWGFTYQPATPPNYDNGVVSVNIFP